MIYRKQSISKSLTLEYGLVKEQLMLMQDGNLTDPEYITAKENYEKLLQIVEQLSKITKQGQDALLMWQNIKHLRNEQLRITDKILEKQLTVQLEEQQDEHLEGPLEEPSRNEKKIEQVAWKK